jgi:hypothetical protein
MAINLEQSGVSRGLYTRNQFELSDNNFLAKDTVQLETEITLRQAVSDASICDGQGFIKCGCSASGKSICNTERCLCRKNGLMCNNRCHPNITCMNK